MRNVNFMKLDVIDKQGESAMDSFQFLQQSKQNFEAKKSGSLYVPATRTRQAEPTPIKPVFCFACNQHLIEEPEKYCKTCFQLQVKNQSDWAIALRAGLIVAVFFLGLFGGIAFLFWVFGIRTN